MDIKAESGPENVVTIKVIGVGGAGNNVVNRMVKAGTKGVDFIAVNTDKQALSISNARNKLQIGEKTTKGQGAGSDPEVGKRAAEESRSSIQKIVEDADMVFVTAGMGGGTGTGAGPLVAQVAREAGVLTVGVVTKPFKFEGKRRMDQASIGIQDMLGNVDALLIIPNDRLKYATDQKITLANAFEIADDVLQQAVTSISDLIKNTGFINLDFADVSAVMKNAGFAHMGTGRAEGKSKAEEAAKLAIASPLLETSIDGAKGVIINIVGSDDMTLEDVEAAASLVQEAANPDANIIFGANFDQTMKDEIKVTVIATGFEDNPNAQFHYTPSAVEAKSSANPSVSMPIFSSAPVESSSNKEDDYVIPIIPTMNKEDRKTEPQQVKPESKISDSPNPIVQVNAQPLSQSNAQPVQPAVQSKADDIKPVMAEVQQAKEEKAAAEEESAAAQKKEPQEDPFDSIFKIFNTK